ncbi:hypothetical protein BGZ99_009881 [Dissophora globulifera]|uniref:RRM domain-containing protein n=1 Tax=Dissophora globulifera TaxID=979702 RepID=A0A9P6R7G5_9FUNG|nr:hypothetical protein BGZ99_009881 [Dissophora globulifera]
MDQFATQQQQQGSPAIPSSSQPTTPAAALTASSSGTAAANAAGTTPAFQPDENSKTLYVGNLDQSVNETFLQEMFSQTGGQVESVKIIRDKNFAHQGGLNYGFVEFTEHAAAETALQSMNGRRVMLQEIKVNWAFTGQVAGKEDTAAHYHIFIGDLSPEINDEALSTAFSAFGSMTDARVMWDANSGKSRGYGFAAYKERADAERALLSMNGQVLGNRAVRCNWASQRGMPGPAFHHPGMGHHAGNSFKMVASQSPQFNTTVYVGNLPPHTTQEDLIPFFQPFGAVVDIRLQADRGFAFVKLETHDKAANAIVRLAGTMINGRPAKLSWGKDRTAENAVRGNQYGYYNNGGGYGMGGHQNNGGYAYQYNNHMNHHNNNHYGGNGQGGYGRNGPHHHHNQHHHNQHHQHHHGNNHHMGNHHNQQAFQHQHQHHHQHQHQQQHHHHQQHQHQQQQQQQVGGLDGVPGVTGSSALAAGSSALPPANAAVGSNNGNMSQEAYEQFSSFSNNGGSR